MSGSSHLSRIETQWSVVNKAHNSKSNEPALSQLLETYGPAIKRYLMASMRNPEAVDEVFQEFALKLVRGDFRVADSKKGQFRKLIKTVLYRLMIDYYRRAQRDVRFGSGQEVEDIGAESIQADSLDNNFTIAWRSSLLETAWNRLQRLQLQTSKPYHLVLRARVDHPEMTTRQLYDHLQTASEDLPKETAFRVFLHRARKRFAAILLDLIKESIDDPSPEDIEMELIELGLHHFCKPMING